MPKRPLVTYRGTTTTTTTTTRLVVYQKSTGEIIELKRWGKHDAAEQFDWGNFSPAAHDLALSLLAHHCQEHRYSPARFWKEFDEGRLQCAQHYQAFLAAHVSRWYTPGFMINTAEIDFFLWQQKQKEQEASVGAHGMRPLPAPDPPS